MVYLPEIADYDIVSLIIHNPSEDRFSRKVAQKYFT